MTEPEHSDVSASAEVVAPVHPEVAAFAVGPVGEPESVPEPAPALAPVPVDSEVVLATYEPHTFQATPELAITPAGAKVPAHRAAELIELGAKNGVHVYQMGS